MRYGEPVPEPKPQPPEEPDDDDDRVDLSVLAVMSEDQPLPAEGTEAREPFANSPWWEGGSRPEGTADDDDDDPVDTSVLAAMSEDQPAVPPAQGTEAREPFADSPWWEGRSTPEGTAEEEPDAGGGEVAPGAPHLRSDTAYDEPVPEPKSQPAEEPDDEDNPVELSVPAAMPEDQPAVPPAEGGETEEPVVSPPWWGGGSRSEETAEEEPDAGGGEVAPGAPYLYGEAVYGESVPEPKPQPLEELNDDDQPVDMSVPAALSEDQPAVPSAETGEEHAVEEPPADGGEPDRQPPASPGGFSLATEALPEGPPGELIRSMVAEVCPGELLLVGTDQAPLPEWARAAVTAARDDLDRRLAEREPIDASEYLRLAIVENVMGLHEEADGHLKDALPRSDRFGPVLNALAVTSLARGKIAPAIVYCKEALRETGGDDSVRAAASSNLGDLYRLEGNTAQAAEAYETAIKCLGPQGESRWLPRLHLRVGRLYRRLGQTDNARRHLSDSVRLFKDSGDEAGHVRSLVALGSALTESGLHDLALRNVEEAVRICLRTGDKPGAALVQAELGVIYMAQDQLTRALAYFESALSLYRELGNRGGEAATLNNMGKIYDSRGDVGEARRFYEAAQEINREQGHEVGQAARRPQLESGDQEDARARLLKAEEIFSRAGSAEQQEDARQTTEKRGPGTEGLR